MARKIISIFFKLQIILSAFLIFQIQPIIAKVILPWFGGTAAVWTVALTFFQLMLLAGYLYSYALSKFFTLRWQALIHFIVMVCSVWFLPISPAYSLADAEPIFSIVLILLFSIGLPYLLLSSTGPLVQSWSYILLKKEPYRLYALSNFASLLGLLAYPFMIEPLSRLKTQMNLWSIGFGFFLFFAAAISIYIFLKNPAKEETLPTVKDKKPNFAFKWRWVVLSAAPVILFMSATNVISEDIASVPFFWILPLSLYLLSFVWVFGKKSRSSPILFSAAFLALALIGEIFLASVNLPISVRLLILPSVVFLGALLCHDRLHRLRPASIFLTEYYIYLSIGGALGGLFVSIIAPLIFNINFEFPLIIVLIGSYAIRNLVARRRILIAGAICLAAILILMIVNIAKYYKDAELVDRNFYGSSRIVSVDGGGASFKFLYNGKIVHGNQLEKRGKRVAPSSYYGNDSGIGKLFSLFDGKRLSVGAIGLGAGTVSAYGMPGDEFIFYEINPLVKRVALTNFSFISESKAKCEIILGDGRMSLASGPKRNFDILIIDAFSGDAIPAHLLTLEAMQVYLNNLNRAGAIAFNVSNRYLNLPPVVKGLADKNELMSVLVENDDNDNNLVYASTWILVGRKSGVLEILKSKNKQERLSSEKEVIWSDDYYNLIGVLQ